MVVKINIINIITSILVPGSIMRSNIVVPNSYNSFPGLGCSLNFLVGSRFWGRGLELGFWGWGFQLMGFGPVAWELLGLHLRLMGSDFR